MLLASAAHAGLRWRSSKTPGPKRQGRHRPQPPCRSCPCQPHSRQEKTHQHPRMEDTPGRAAARFPLPKATQPMQRPGSAQRKSWFLGGALATAIVQTLLHAQSIPSLAGRVSRLRSQPHSPRSKPGNPRSFNSDYTSYAPPLRRSIFALRGIEYPCGELDIGGGFAQAARIATPTPAGWVERSSPDQKTP